MNVVFITRVAVVAADPSQSRRLFMEALGLLLSRRQATSRLLTDDGLIVGISYAPSLHHEEPA